ncbi:MAG: hypothetical protein HW418_3456 [Anaerolineales bacterium]|nr:hypothetical protein [Anaerolineales bacterium]
MLDFVFGLRVVLAMAVFWQAGALCLTLVRAYSLHWIEGLCLGFGLGIGLIGMEMLGLALIGLPLEFVVIVAPWVIGWAVCLVWRRPSWSRPGWGLWPRLALKWVEVVPTVAILLIVGTVLFRATFHPLFEWDSWAIWDIKARAFYYQRGLQPFITDSYYWLTQLDYPVLYPLAGTFVYVCLGQTSDVVLLIPAGLFTALAGVFYCGLRRYGSSRALALWLTLVLVGMPHTLFWSEHFQAEIPLLFFVVVNSLYLFFHLTEPRREWLLLAALAAGLATQVKIEGLLFVALGLAILPLRALAEASPILRRHFFKAAAGYGALIAGCFLPWFIYHRLVTASEGHLAASSFTTVAQNIHLLPLILWTAIEWATQFNRLGAYLLIFPVTPVLILLNYRRTLTRFPHLFLLGQVIMALVPAALFFLTYPQFATMDNMGRYLVIVSTLVYLLFALHASDLFHNRLRLTATPKVSGSIRLQRVVVGAVGAAVLAVNFIAAAWPGLIPFATFYEHPVAMMRYVIAIAREMASQTPAERRQILDARVGAPVYGFLMHVAQTITPPAENVAVWAQSDNTEFFLLQRSYYLLYPRKVFVLRDAAEITLDRLQAARVSTVIGYDREVPTGGLSGQTVYQDGSRFSVVRLNALEAPARNALDFHEASVQFAGGISLTGYQIVPTLLDKPLLMILYWHTTQPIPKSYTVFVHGYSGEEFVAQHDSPPVLGQWPTQLWQPGSTVVDAHPLTLTREQQSNARFCLGMYDSVTLDRLHIISAEGYDVQDNIACRSLREP